MIKWEYLYVQVNHWLVSAVEGPENYTGFLPENSGKVRVDRFLQKSGQDGWEVVGMSDAGSIWRLILKRPIA